MTGPFEWHYLYLYAMILKGNTSREPITIKELIKRILGNGICKGEFFSLVIFPPGIILNLRHPIFFLGI